jgi:serine/threonine protein kinase
MGEVYKARDTRLDRTVAIKVLPAPLASDIQFRDRFDQEARTTSKLDHPHICALYDIGEGQGTSLLVMQYLAGETLADRLTRGPENHARFSQDGQDDGPRATSPLQYIRYSIR